MFLGTTKEVGMDDKKRILVVDDNEADIYSMERWLGRIAGHEVSSARSIPMANFLTQEALRSNKKFDVVFVDISIGQDLVTEFFQRLSDITPETNVVIITAQYSQEANLRFKPDAMIIKTSNIFKQSDTLVSVMNEMSQPIRMRKDTSDVILNRWVATSTMHGISSLLLFTREYTGISEEEKTEKFISFDKDGRWINTVVYPGFPGDNLEPISVQTTIGCNILCEMCSNWRNQCGADGNKIPYVRALTTEELIAQVYMAMGNSRIKKLFQENNNAGLLVNFTGPGDGLVNNLGCCAKMILKLSKIEKPLVSFIITSVGREDRLREYLEKYITLPRVTMYWSVNSLDKKIRDTLMPGTRGQSLDRMANLYEKIAEATGQKVTASWALFRGVNDSLREAKRIVSFFKDRPLFKIKLMAGCPENLPDVPNTRDEDVVKFEQMLLDAGLEQVRIRKIFGNNGYSGCGQTEANFIVMGRQL